MKKLLLTLLIIFSLCSCKLLSDNISERKDVEHYLELNYGGIFTYINSDRIDFSTTVYHFKSSNLGNKIVSGIVVMEKDFNGLASQDIPIYYSNYLPVKFQEREARYFEDALKPFFPECKVLIDNSNYFIKMPLNNKYFYNEYNISDFNNFFFRDSYLSKDNESLDRFRIILKTANSQKFTDSQLIKSELVDLAQKTNNAKGTITILRDDANVIISKLTLDDLPIQNKYILNEYSFEFYNSSYTLE